MEENTMTSMEEQAPRKKNQRVSVTYVNAEGENKVPQGDCAGIHVTVRSEDATLVDEVVEFTNLPREILARLLAFGANVAARNAVNTAPSIEEGAEAFLDRFKGFSEGVWRTAGEGSGSGVTDVIQAMINAYKAAGKSDDVIEKKTAEWVEHFAGLTKENKKKQNAAWLNVAPVRAEYDLILAKKAEERLKKLKAQAKTSRSGQADHAALEDL